MWLHNHSIKHGSHRVDCACWKHSHAPQPSIYFLPLIQCCHGSRLTKVFHSSFSLVTFSTSRLQWVLQKVSSQLDIRKKNLQCLALLSHHSPSNHWEPSTISRKPWPRPWTCWFAPQPPNSQLRTEQGHVSVKPTERHICNKQGCTSEVPTSETLYYPAPDIQLCLDILCMNIIKRTGDEGRPWKSPTPPLKMMMLDFVQRM